MISDSERIHVIELLAALPGEATVRDLLHPFGLGMHWHDVCKHCGQPVVNFGGEAGYEENHPWLHSTGSRGCRTASVDGKPVSARWDESLNRTWKATPGGHWDEHTYDACHVCQLVKASEPE